MNPTLFYCTVADSRFILETITLFRSLLKTADTLTDISFTVLCLDERAQDICLKTDPRIKTLLLSDINDPELMATQKNRKVSEFAQTSKASLVCHLLNNMSPGAILTFIDSDIYYFSDPVVTLKDKDVWSIMITSHWFSEKKKELEKKVGIYNSGFICFKNDSVGRNCAAVWRKDCIEWCFNRVDIAGKFTDQFYLEKWPHLFKPLVVSTNKGLNVGTWNADRFKITLNQVDGDTLVCFHFHGLKLYLDKNNIKAYPITVGNKNIYRVYIHALQEVYDEIKRYEPDFPFRFSENPGRMRVLKQIITRWYRDIRQTIIGLWSLKQQTKD